MTTKNKLSNKALAFILLMGALAGFCNGFLGAAGGIILLYALRKASTTQSNESVRDRFASCVLIVLVLSVVSAVTYSQKNTLDTSALLILALPGAIGGICGAILTDKLDTTLLKLIFSVILIIAGINMVF